MRRHCRRPGGASSLSAPPEAESLPAGVYEHYKGAHYLVLGGGRYDPTDEQVVIYVRLYSRPGWPLSVRPWIDFFAEVEHEGRRVPRFRFVGAQQP